MKQFSFLYILTIDVLGYFQNSFLCHVFNIKQMRKKIVAGNWKMNLTRLEAVTLAASVIKEFNDNTPSEVEVVMCPPFLFMEEVIKLTSSYSMISVGAQNCASQNSGAFTGEVSAKMIESISAKYVILGHSERRAMYHETNEILIKKLEQVLATNLLPIFCCGETLSERESGKHFEVIKDQLTNGLFHLNAEHFARVVIAYEPVWAIGTGITASSAQAQEMHQFIRSILIDKYGDEVAQNCSLLYGGSCNATNAAELFLNKDIDGGLIGGASLKAKDFVSIANSFPS